jgi:PIN domain nuclease of toxin-antitoxin system
VKGVLLDTHAMVWSLLDGSLLSERARVEIGRSEAVYVSPISFFEIAQKARIGKWPEIEPFLDALPQLLRDHGSSIAELSPEIALSAGAMKWSHRDPFDRFLAATALHYALPLISADLMFDGLVARIW